jgi:hypothetical protein
VYKKLNLFASISKKPTEGGLSNYLEQCGGKNAKIPINPTVHYLQLLERVRVELRTSVAFF